MKKKIGVHVDALVAIALVLVSAFGFIAWQRVEYSDLLQDNINRQWKQMLLETEVARLQVELRKALSSPPAIAPK